ncbi:MAG: exodeoxyribonuclease VII large subunit [Candidatus Sumerlaeia bacterium]
MTQDDLFQLIEEFRQRLGVAPSPSPPSAPPDPPPPAQESPGPTPAVSVLRAGSSDGRRSGDPDGGSHPPAETGAGDQPADESGEEDGPERPSLDPRAEAVEPEEPEPAPRRPLSVSEVTGALRDLVETSFGLIEVEGEISNWRRQRSGHCYFSLKDERAVLPCVMFRGDALGLRFEPQNGHQAVAVGRLGIYEKQGVYQLYVETLRPAGLGDLHRRFLELRDRLEREGLFDQAHKKPLPFLPQTIAVVTSPTGAAIRDILTVLRRRFANLRVLVFPVSVQGERAAPEIAAAIRRLDAWRDRLHIDVLIVARGGGSMEDLWAFNEEVVARAVFDCRIPVISGVGHEIDFTICDFAADVRAPTPSAAAELVVQNQQELLRRVAALADTLVRAMRHVLSVRRERVRRLRQHYALRHPVVRVREFAQRLDELDERLHDYVRTAVFEKRSRLERAAAPMRAHCTARLREAAQRIHDLTVRLRLCAGARVRDAAQHLQRAAGQLHALGPDAVLSRGYSIVRRTADGAVVLDAAALSPGDGLQIVFHRGAADARVETISPAPPPEEKSVGS